METPCLEPLTPRGSPPWLPFEEWTDDSILAFTEPSPGALVSPCLRTIIMVVNASIFVSSDRWALSFGYRPTKLSNSNVDFVLISHILLMQLSPDSVDLNMYIRSDELSKQDEKSPLPGKGEPTLRPLYLSEEMRQAIRVAVRSDPL